MYRVRVALVEYKRLRLLPFGDGWIVLDLRVVTPIEYDSEK
jgi:hypothetical protein